MVHARTARRIGPVLGSALRHAMVPIGSLLVPWWVVRHAPMSLWGNMVPLLVLVQLAVHLAQWGQRDLLLRMFRSGHVDGAAAWRINGWSRAVIAAPVLVLPALAGTGSLPWVLLWAFAAATAAGFEPLVVRSKRFLEGWAADCGGLAAQFVVLWMSDILDVDLLVRSFAVHHAVRALLLWVVCGAPRPWPPAFDLRQHVAAAVPFVLIGLGGLLATRIDLYAVTVLADKELIGPYQVVAALFVQFQVVPGLLARPFTTGLQRMAPQALVRAADRALGRGLLWAWPQAALAWVVLTYFFHLHVGWPVLAAGALSVVPASGYVPLFPALYAAHRERWVVLVSFGAAACIAAGAWLLVPRWGIAGGLAAAAAGQWAQWAGVRALVQHLQRTKG